MARHLQTTSDKHWRCMIYTETYPLHLNLQMSSPSETDLLDDKKARGAAPRSGDNGNWKCRKCSNVNFPQVPQKQLHNLLAFSFLKCAVVNNFFCTQRGKCNRCGEPGGNWTCPKCGNLNYAHRDQCNRCDLPRPGMMVGMGSVPAMEESARALVSCFSMLNPHSYMHIVG